MPVVRNQELEEKDINSTPLYYESMSNNPYQTRLDQATDVRENIFRIQQAVPFEMSFTSGGVPSDTTTQTVVHNLGYRPFVLGSYKMTVSDNANLPVEQRGFIPEFRQYRFIGAVVANAWWSLYLTDINELDMKVTLSMYSDGDTTGSLSGELLLFKELSI